MNEKKKASAPKYNFSREIAFEFRFVYENASAESEKKAKKKANLGKPITATGRAIEALYKTAGVQAGSPVVHDTCILVPVALQTEGLFRSGQAVSEAIALTAKELCKNVASGRPLPHAAALTDVRFVPLLRAIANNSAQGCGAPTLIDERGARQELPALDVQSFDEPVDEAPARIVGTFQVTGFRVGSANEVLLELDGASMVVRPDPATEKEAMGWSFGSLRAGIWIDANATRDDAEGWHLEPGAKVVRGKQLPYDEGNADAGDRTRSS